MQRYRAGTSMTTFMSLVMMVTRVSLAGTFLSGYVAASDQRHRASRGRAFLLPLNKGISRQDLKSLGTSNERNKRERFCIAKSP